VEGLSPEIKRPELETDHLPPPITKVINALTYTSTPLYLFMVRYLIKHRIQLHGVVKVK
jgi:hypothetical protein